MSVRSRIATLGAVPAMKASGGAEPPAMRQAARAVSQMDMAHPFAPGEPIRPFDGYSRTPRAHDFGTGYNVATRPRTHERVSFGTLRGLIDAYDVARICIWHRIDSIRSLDWKLIAADGYSGDVTAAIALGMEALAKPDREASFETWLAKWLYDVLAYDAGALYRMRNRGGRVVGLSVPDGTTIAPLLDYWGNSPKAPPGEPQPEAYVQYVNGLPWNWLTRDDLIYEPYRPRTSSPYGDAPLESIILNANTDIRFQVYFLQRFTEGNIPEAFASAPESWNPEQIEQFQAYWDSFMYGDQAAKHQIKWMPGGSTIAWSNEKDFTDAFSLHMMRKTCAAYHVVPSDLGFTESVNRSSGESQADVQHRVGDLPLGRHAERVITSFLQRDLGLPLKHQFDWGEEQDDRLQQAQADQLYIDRAVVSASEIREMRYGLAEPAGTVVPRVFFTTRAGPIPLNSLYGVAGQVDSQTAAPAAGAPLPRQAFTTVPGVIPVPPMQEMPLAEREFGPAALPAAPAPQPGTVAKNGATAGITAGTGISSYDLPGGEDERAGDREAVAKAEMAAFSRFARARRKAGMWRDFTFAAVGPVRAHQLNDEGRLLVRKAAGQVAAAGLAVLAADTGRVLMLQRALTGNDPAGGMWEFPGGHLEQGETALQAAWREWAEETGCVPPPGVQTGAWTAGDGIYQGITWTADSEASVPVRAGAGITNPDDPDGDQVEAIAWWDPEQLPGNPAIRPELLGSIGAVMAALGCGGATDPAQGDEAVCPCGTPAVFDELNGCQHADGSVSHDDGEPVSDKTAAVAKAADARPEALWPGWELDGKAVAHWAPQITAAVTAVLTDATLRRMAADYLAAHPRQQGTAPGKQDRNDAAYIWLAAWLATLGISLPLGLIAVGIVTDGYLIGAVSAGALAADSKADTGGWQPGDTKAANERLEALGAAAALGAILALAADTAAGAITVACLGALSRVLAGADGTASAERLAADLGAAAADSGTAEAAAADQVTTASCQAARDRYEALGVTEVAWVTDPGSKSGVCSRCLANEAVSPRPLGEPWPNGNAPVHRWCNCAEVPVRLPGEAGHVS